MIPCGQYAQEAGCHDREHQKNNKVLFIGHRPPHTKRRFFVKKIIFLGNKQKKSCSVPFSTASTVYSKEKKEEYCTLNTAPYA